MLGFTKPIYIETTIVDSTITNNITYSDLENRLKNSTLNILFMSRIEKYKGIYSAIDSFHRLQNNFKSDTSLKIAGIGSELENVKNYVARKKINNIEFLGFIRGKKKAEILKNSSLYLFPSSHDEGMPNSLLEALGAGLPVLTTLKGGIKDFFNNQMGLEIENPNDIDEIYTKLINILKDRERMIKMSKFNYIFSQKYFTSEKVGKRLIRIIQNTIKDDHYNKSWYEINK